MASNRNLVGETIALQLIVLGIMAAISAWAWPQIPDGKLIPIHWGISGRPDGFAPKQVGLGLLPVLLVILIVPITIRLKTEAFRENLEKSRTILLVTFAGTYLMLLAAQCLIIFTALGYNLPVVAIVTGSMGVLLSSIGVMLGTGMTKRNASVGVRTPWTLKDDVVWDKTNRLSGWLLALTGVLVMGAAAMQNYFLVAAVVLGGVGGSVIFAMTYSRRLYNQTHKP